jgi:hypothetical protein
MNFKTNAGNYLNALDGIFEITEWRKIECMIGRDLRALGCLHKVTA